MSADFWYNDYPTARVVDIDNLGPDETVFLLEVATESGPDRGTTKMVWSVNPLELLQNALDNLSPEERVKVVASLRVTDPS